MSFQIIFACLITSKNNFYNFVLSQHFTMKRRIADWVENPKMRNEKCPIFVSDNEKVFYDFLVFFFWRSKARRPLYGSTSNDVIPCESA